MRSLLADPTCYNRTYPDTEDRSWEDKGVDVEAKLQQIEEKDPAVHIQLLLAHAFGLRTEEAILLQPHGADRGDVLFLTRGTEGGRKRHGYANRRYDDLTGVPTPVRGGKAESETESEDRGQVAEELGRGRTQIIRAHRGGRGARGSAPTRCRLITPSAPCRVATRPIEDRQAAPASPIIPWVCSAVIGMLGRPACPGWIFCGVPEGQPQSVGVSGDEAARPSDAAASLSSRCALGASV
jgi:hypothetical protein